ncbi:hypothetical protein JTE90_016294 [Oedothorax gibbosus]|uniref:CN hydrolase domain-containing protein n=1 Tax=Oedothorax gibbosus TaxID=931172 RepID=A0AAV6U2D0_9ARAC|nr:hypothetical protein JTE90_016294 [Oedothorax gibbosus]
MSLNLRTLGVLIVIVSISSLVSADKDFYRAAVLELAQFADLSYSPSEVAQRNLKLYETAVTAAATDQADIIVFPESGLFPLLKINRSVALELSENIPNPKLDAYNPCKENYLTDIHPILTKLSCLAKENGIFVVANIIDRKNCEFSQFCDANDSSDFCSENSVDCPDDGNIYFNTNVVFNRKGLLVAKYYKRHLYFEPDMRTSDYPGNVYFATDFGNFTTAICFDLVYKDLVDAVNKPEIANVAFSTNWLNHLPFFYFSIPIQQAFAIANSVNVLASNVNNPRVSLGSGIYSGDRGALIYSLTPDRRTKLLIANVPKVVGGPRKEIVTNAKRFIIREKSAVEDATDEKGIPLTDDCTTEVLVKLTDKYTDFRCSPPVQNTFEFIKLEGNRGDLEVCSGSFCCSLSYEATSMDEEYFLVYSANPLTFQDSYEQASEACFVACCEEVGNVPCRNYKLHSYTVFQKIHLKGNFSTQYVYPFVVDSGIRLTERDSWQFKGKREIIYQNVNSNSSIIFIGLHGRIFDEDKEHLQE